MAKMKRILFFIATLSALNGFLARSTLAVPITATYAWGKPAPVLVEVTFYPEADLTGTSDDWTPDAADGLYAYTLTNRLRPAECRQLPCPPNAISLFRVANPDSINGVMYSPKGWSAKVDPDGGFVWETTDPSITIGMGESLKGFLLFSPGPYGVLTSPPFEMKSQIGRVRLGFEGREELDVFGPISGPLLPRAVPEPSTLLLLGAGLLAVGRRLWSRRS